MTDASRRSACRVDSSRAQRCDQVAQGGMQDVAFGEVADLRRALLAPRARRWGPRRGHIPRRGRGDAGVQSDSHAAGHAPRREVHAAAAARRRNDHRFHVRIGETGPVQRRCQQPGLPRAIVGVTPMLQDAATALAEMHAGRRNAGFAVMFDFGARCEPAVALAPQSFDPHVFAGQRIRNIERRAVGSAGDAVALGADAIDGNRFGGQPNAFSPVCARPRISACTSCVPS